MQSTLLAGNVLALVFLTNVQKEIKQAVKDQESVEKAIDNHKFFKKAWIKKRKN